MSAATVPGAGSELTTDGRFTGSPGRFARLETVPCEDPGGIRHAEPPAAIEIALIRPRGHRGRRPPGLRTAVLAAWGRTFLRLRDRFRLGDGAEVPARQRHALDVQSDFSVRRGAVRGRPAYA